MAGILGVATGLLTDRCSYGLRPMTFLFKLVNNKAQNGWVLL